MIVDNPTVEQVLTTHEVIDALENVHRDLATGQAINTPPYRVFTPPRREE